jgi:hypothetical protein
VRKGKMSVQCLTSSTVLNCEGGSLGLEGEQNNKQGTDKKAFFGARSSTDSRTSKDAFCFRPIGVG